MFRRAYLLSWVALGLLALAGRMMGEGNLGNRLVYLQTDDPFYVGVNFPKLTTPQWVGEPGVDVVVILGIDDMSQTARYEEFLRPILERLKRLDGRAPVSIFCNAITPDDPQLAAWLREGLSLEVHTLSHPCPILAKHDFAAAENTFHGGVDLLNHVAGNVPVAFRTPCCDSINSPSPRMYAELFQRTNAAGQFLHLDSSVVLLLTTNDPVLPRDGLTEPDGRGRFTKYVPFPSFATTVENYPYPWVIGNRCWEFACMAPSDWEAQNILGRTNPVLVADWKVALDAVALKQGGFNFVFHPHGWSTSAQLVEFIDYATTHYGPRVKFLNYREADERLTRHLTLGQSLRSADGGDQGVRLLDLNNDGFLDVLVGNEAVHRTRVWQPSSRQWFETDCPVSLVQSSAAGGSVETGVCFGVMHGDERATMLVRNEQVAGAWSYEGGRWVEEPHLLRGLELDGHPVLTRRAGQDRGVRLRDVDGDGICELIVSNESQNAVFQWDAVGETWERLPFALPSNISLVNALGEDNGLRFVDVNEDGHDDLLFSNESSFALWLYVPKPILGWSRGWTRKIVVGARTPVAPGANTPADEIPPFFRSGPHRNNGAWIHARQLWVQNEDTAHLPDLVERRSFDDLLRSGKTAPQSPTEALANFQVRSGFHVDLVAAEPLVQDPVAFDWGADGRLWVAEMRDYPLGMDGHGKPGGVIKFLEDTDGDGRYDRATEFLREVPFPSSVMPWRRGVLVCAAPDIFYAEDTDGDGRADWRRILFTGFTEGNQQHRVNGFALGLDGWIYGANGDSGGSIRRRLREEKLTDNGWKAVEGDGSTKGTAEAISLQGRDFRFRPDSGEFETVEGPTQYGRTRDDWDQWFGNANYTWLWHYPLAAHYAARNPHLAIREVRSMLTQAEGANRLFPISRALPRPNVVGEDNTVTSACSPSPYRDDLFGPDFSSSVFISEPSENLIHREVLQEQEVTFHSQRAAGEETSEFLASSDPWFRPTQLKTGPDGALYVADMYRLVIEHPEWIPIDTQARIDVRAGDDRGRLYRIVPDGANLRPIPRLDRLDTPALVAALDSPNGWQRDTAMRLLMERRDPRAGPLLAELAQTSVRPKVRLQALAVLGELRLLAVPSVVRGLKDDHPAVRALALRLSEPWLRDRPEPSLATAVLALANDPSTRVVFQLALTLGEFRDPRAGASLVSIGQRFADDPLMLNAILSSAVPHLDAMLTALEVAPKPSTPLLERLLNLAAAQGNERALTQAVAVTLKLDPDRELLTQLRALGGLLDALERKTNAAGRSSLASFAPVFSRAQTAAFDVRADESLRLAALRVLGRGGAGTSVPAVRLAELLEPQVSPPIQRAALAAMQRGDARETPETLLKVWPRLSPTLRGTVMEVLLAQPTWTQLWLDAIESGRFARSEISVPARQKLRQYGNPAVRERAGRLLEVVKSDRQAVVDSYAAVRGMPGDRARGQATFVANCASCHRLQGNGNDVGPDLGTMADKSVDALLVAILDPNRAVEERYLAYTARTRDGREFTGIITSESSSSLTLRAANGVEEVLLRSELASLTSLRQSLMPEGFEYSLDASALADVVAYVTAAGPRPKEFSGNRPQLITRDANGAYRLRAASAEIFGDSLVFETTYGNLGYWQSPNDQAAWMVESLPAGEYDVWLDWARPGMSSRVRLRLEATGGPQEFSVSGSGSWDTYRQMLVGRMHLEAGRQRLVLRGVPPISNPILDLRELRLVPVGQGVPADFPNVVSR